MTPMQRIAGGLGALLLAAAVAGCGRGPGDPSALTREFIAALMTADSDRVSALTCAEWQATTRRWASEGTLGLSVDTDHLTYQVARRGDALAEVRVTGALTLRSPDGRREVRSLDGADAMIFTLINERGWKVCGLAGAAPE